MSGQCVLVTGGSGGIGSELARQLVNRGDTVVLFARRPEPLDALAAELGRERTLAVAGEAGAPRTSTTRSRGPSRRSAGSTASPTVSARSSSSHST